MELIRILFCGGWSLKRVFAAVVAMVAVVLLVCESDDLLVLFGTKVVGLVLLAAVGGWLGATESHRTEQGSDGIAAQGKKKIAAQGKKGFSVAGAKGIAGEVCALCKDGRAVR